MNSNSKPKFLSQKIHVLWVTPTVLDAELHKSARLEIVRSFANVGHRTALVAIRSKQKPLDRELRILTIPLRYVPVIQPIMFAVVLALFLPMYVLHSRPDFIIFTQPDVSIVGSIPGIFVSKLRKVKCVLDIRSTPVETIGFSGGLLKLFFSLSMFTAKNLFDGITIITSQMKGQVSKEFRIDPAKIGVWTSGVSTGLYDPRLYAGKKEELKNRLGLTGKFVVFYHGVFSANRGLAELVEAVRLLKSDYPDIVLFMLGKGPSDQLLKSEIERLGLQSSVIIHKPVEYSEVPKFIAFCDVTTSPLPDHPYWRFQCPLKLLEYMAMEKTIILSDIPAHREVVNGAACGIFVSSAKPTDIAEAIKYAYDNKAKLDAWGATGRRIVEERYTWQKVGSDLEDYLRSL